MSLAPFRRHLIVCAGLLVLATVLRGLWLTADPPVQPSVGVVWHDEGAWVHNARNQALFGVWRTDAWNPMFIAPVFTALETAAFEAMGVGTWQARTVPVVSGLVAIMAVMLGLFAVVGWRAAALGGVLLTTNYTFVMWNRAALMESTMTMFIVMGWAAYAHSVKRPVWGLVAGAAAVLAFFTKAASAFFVGALLLEMVVAWWVSDRATTKSGLRSAGFTLLGLVLAGAVALAVFVGPYWTEFQAYNWDMAVMRKPDYAFRALVDRATWLPLTHPAFMRMWLVLLAAGLAAVSSASRWRTCHPAERLAVLWLIVGFAEVALHDSGNERRYVMFIPGFIVLASMWLGRTDVAQGRPSGNSWGVKTAAALVTGILSYIIIGSGLRLVWLDDILAGDYQLTVRVSAALSSLVMAVVWFRWSVVATWFGQHQPPLLAAGVVLVMTSGTDLMLYRQWASTRTTMNYDASRMLGTLLPPGTRVHGKLANGLALENQMAPVFIGRGFGNYADRFERDDARYILTYTQPRLGYEGSVILDVLQHYPQQRVIAEFDVDETPGLDRAALIDKFPGEPESRARHQ